jgi:hypothetical protein
MGNKKYKQGKCKTDFDGSKSKEFTERRGEIGEWLPSTLAAIQ